MPIIFPKKNTQNLDAKNIEKEIKESENPSEILEFMKSHPRLRKLAKKFEKHVLSIQAKLDKMPDPEEKK